MRIYVASKTYHGPMWLRYRDDKGYPIISSWINEYGPGETENWSDLWYRCIDEARSCDILVVYREADDVLCGALIEVGAALGMNIPVYAVGKTFQFMSFRHHRNVTLFDTLDEAFKAIEEYVD